MGQGQPDGRGPAGDCPFCRRRLVVVRWLGIFLAIAWISTAALAQNPNDGAPTFTVSDLPVGRPLRIIVYGDMRFTEPSNTSDTWPGVRKWLAQKVGEEKPDLLLLTGDMPFQGGNADDWKVYFQETAL